MTMRNPHAPAHLLPFVCATSTRSQSSTKVLNSRAGRVAQHLRYAVSAAHADASSTSPRNAQHINLLQNRVCHQQLQAVMAAVPLAAHLLPPWLLLLLAALTCHAISCALSKVARAM
jgi:hypothetical protein